LQLHATLPTIAALAPSLGGLGRTVVIDHYGLLQAASGPDQAGWPELLALLRQEDVYLKLSAPDLASRAAGFADLSSFVAALARCAPQRLLWGSNWPHTQGTARSEAAAAAHAVEPFREVDDADVLRQLQRWLGDARYRQVMVGTPGLLYHFAGNRRDLSAS
jgi:2-pyrone-4,6-dicarboxylate lactonase